VDLQAARRVISRERVHLPASPSNVSCSLNRCPEVSSSPSTKRSTPSRPLFSECNIAKTLAASCPRSRNVWVVHWTARALRGQRSGLGLGLLTGKGEEYQDRCAGFVILTTIPLAILFAIPFAIPLAIPLARGRSKRKRSERREALSCSHAESNSGQLGVGIGAPQRTVITTYTIRALLKITPYAPARIDTLLHSGFHL